MGSWLSTNLDLSCLLINFTFSILLLFLTRLGFHNQLVTRKILLNI
jgi:hypothetical protein